MACYRDSFTFFSLFKPSVSGTGSVSIVRCKGGKVPTLLGPLLHLPATRCNCSAEQNWLHVVSNVACRLSVVREVQ
jgi:hypothetical protein